MKTDDVATAFWVWLVLCVLHKAGCNTLPTKERIYCEIGNVCKLNCSAAYNSSTVVWKKNDNDIILDIKSGLSKNPAKYAVTENGRKLKIKNTTESDKGMYACEVTDEGIRTHNVIVELLDPLGVSIVDYHNGTLQCNASGLPGKYSYNKWEHRSLFGEHIRCLNGTADGYTNVTSNGSNPSYQNNGVYKCSATTDRNKELCQHGEQRVIFEEKPVYVSEARQIIYSDVGERVVLSVAFVSFPVFTDVYWLKSAGLKVVTSEKYYQITNHFNISSNIYESTVTIEGYNTSLEIDNIQKGDDCHYTVVVINPRGETRCTVQLVLNDAKPFTIPVVVVSVAAVAIMLVVMCIVFWKCKKAASSDGTCHEDRYEKKEYKRKRKQEDIYEEVVLNLTAEGKRFEFVSTDNLV